MNFRTDNGSDSMERHALCFILDTDPDGSRETHARRERSAQDKTCLLDHYFTVVDPHPANEISRFWVHFTPVFQSEGGSLGL
mgnify:CR=1 FL=1